MRSRTASRVGRSWPSDGGPSSSSSSCPGDAALTIHLKMTGQLFVVPAETPLDPYVRLVLELADGRELRFRDIRKFGKVGLYGRDPITGELVTEVGGAAVFAAIGPEPLDDAFTLREFRRGCAVAAGRLKSLLLDQSFVAGVGNIYADEALWRARLHPLRSAVVAPTAGRAAAVRGDPGGPRRRPSSGAAPRSTTTRRPTATARCRSGSMSTSGPASRARAAADRSSGSSSARVRPTSARGASGCRPRIARAPGAILRTMTGGDVRHGRRWTDLAGGARRPRRSGPRRWPRRTDDEASRATRRPRSPMAVR